VGGRSQKATRICRDSQNGMEKCEIIKRCVRKKKTGVPGKGELFLDCSHKDNRRGGKLGGTERVFER